MKPLKEAYANLKQARNEVNHHRTPQTITNWFLARLDVAEKLLQVGNLSKAITYYEKAANEAQDYDKEINLQKFSLKAIEINKGFIKAAKKEKDFDLMAFGYDNISWHRFELIDDFSDMKTVGEYVKSLLDGISFYLSYWISWIDMKEVKTSLEELFNHFSEIDDPQILKNGSLLYSTAAKWFKGIKDNKYVEHCFLNAEKIALRLTELDEENYYNILLTIKEDLAEFHFTHGKLGEALSRFEEVNKIFEKHRKDLSNTKFLMTVSRNQSHLFTLYSSDEEYDKAAEFADEFYEIQKEVVRKVPTYENFETLFRAIKCQYEVYHELDEIDIMLDVLDEFLSIYPDYLKKHGPKNKLERINRFSDAVTYVKRKYVEQLGDSKEALVYFQRKLEEKEKHLEEQTEISKKILIEDYNFLASALFNNRNTEEAIEAYRKAIQIKESLFNPDDPSFYELTLILNYDNLGDLLIRLNRKDEALEVYLKGLKFFKFLYKNYEKYQRIPLLRAIHIFAQIIRDIYQDLANEEEVQKFDLGILQIEKLMAEEEDS